MQKITNFSRYTYDPKKDVVITLKTNKARPFRGRKNGYKCIHLLDDEGRFRTVSRQNIVNDSVPANPSAKRGRPRKTSAPARTATQSTEQTVSLPLSVCKDVVSGKISMAEMHAYLALKCSPDTVSVKKITQSTLSKLIKKNLITVI